MPHLLVLREHDDFAPCVDYVLRLFARTQGFTVEFASPGSPPQAPSAAETICLVYDRAPDAAHVRLQSLPAPPKHALGIRRASLFGPDYLRQATLPEDPAVLLRAAATGGVEKLVSTDSSALRWIGTDLLASAFWFLSRHEEYVTETRDPHGRFLCSMSAAPPEMYDLPVVNRWFEQLREYLLNLLQVPKAAPDFSPRQTIALTHDVDLLRKYRGLGALLRSLATMKSHGLSAGLQEATRARKVLFGKARDPYDSFEGLYAVKERVTAPSTFFFMGGGTTKLDRDYSLDDLEVRTLISRAKAFGDEIGVHPSYQSGTSRAVIEQEAAAVRKATGCKIQGSRQHYLRASLPETLRLLGEAGLRYDSSLGFPDRAGFRCGWSGCFHPFDVQTREELPIIEIPLIVMDVTLAVYEKIPSELSLERLAQLLDASEARGGAYVFLWHNVLRDADTYPGYWDTFEYFFSACAGGARYATLNTLADEFESRGVAGAPV